MSAARSAAHHRRAIDALRRATCLVAFALAACSGGAHGSTGSLQSPVDAPSGPSVRDLVPNARPPAMGRADAATAGARRVGTIEAELVADRTAVSPGGTVRLGLRLRHDARWHTYWRNPGDSGLATQFAPVLPSGWSVGPIEWPAPRRFALGPLANYGYEGEVVLPVTVRAPADAAAEPVQASATVQWLACHEVCVPGEATLSLSLPVLGAGQAAPSRWAPLFDAMAARTPVGAPLEARLHATDGGVSLVFAAAVGAAEFFPYDPGVIEPAAPQALHALDTRHRRLELVRAQTPPPGAAALPPVPDRLAGVLVADGRPVEVVARLDSSPAPLGERIGVALARPEPASGGAAGALAAGTPALALAIGSALLGGLLLNLMPCVFPVIGLKLLGFAHDGAGHPGRARRHAWAFGAGILAAFLALAAGLLALRSAGQAVGWGFQLQSPVFVAAMALLFVAVGLNFSGVYEVGSGLTRLGPTPAGQSGADAPDRPLLGSFGAGLLATLVATPCTAPFMGSAVGFTLGQPGAIVLAVFAAVGIGMALPYVLLAHAPGLARRLPRPGRWMQTLRQLLAFPMYATAAWLAWVLVQQSDADAVLRLGLGMVAIGLAGWVWGRFAQRRAWPAALASLGSVGVALGLIWPISVAAPGAPVASGAALPDRVPGAAWEPYDEARLQALRGQGRVVLVDFTAAWCISCQANKRLVLDARAVRTAFAQRDVALLRADWTRRDPRITAALAAFGRNGVPLYLVYSPGVDAPAILPEILTASSVLRAIGG